MPVPHIAARRLLVAPFVALLEVALLLASPLLLAVAVVLSPLLGGWRPVRMLAIVLVFAARHLEATLLLLGLWVRSGFGRTAGSDRMQQAHFDVMRRFVGGVYRTIVRAARVRVAVNDSAKVEEVLDARDRPALVLARHAGEGDSLLILHQLLCRYGRNPRIVLHEALRLDPVIDVLGRRLPNRFIDPRGGDTELDIAAMSADLEPASAVLIFPEGGNFSESRRQRGIERLEEGGHHEEAGWARDMRHVAAPRPGGALAAIEAAPGADVVFVGYVGFPTGLRELWRLLPHPQPVEVRLWHVPAADIPTARDERIDWLFDRWRTLDAWVGERQGDPG